MTATVGTTRAQGRVSAGERGPVNRANRRTAGERFAQAEVLGDLEAAEAETGLVGKRPKRWSKGGDVPHGEGFAPGSSLEGNAWG